MCGLASRPPGSGRRGAGKGSMRSGISKKSMTGAASAAIFAIALLLVPSAISAKLGDREIRDHLTEGEQAFRKAMELDRTDPASAREYYQKAILNFERLASEGGIHNGKLFYNIGNAYFRLGDVGRAILFYKRAALYIQNDQNLRQNLDYARNRRADRIEKKERERVFKTLFFLHYDIPSRIKLIIFASTFAALWVSAGVRIFFRIGGLKALLVICAVISALFLASLVVESVSFSRRPEGVITADEVMGRMGDAETYQASFKEPLHAGTEFKLLERRPGWWHIELESGDRTWIPDGNGELVSG
jgi:tetratricopeptide (TPR) repeat protein